MPDGTFFHRAAWATVIEQAFGHRTFYVYAERDGAITGVLPLAQVKTLLFGNTLISVPFCVYGGLLAADRGKRRRVGGARRDVAGAAPAPARSSSASAARRQAYGAKCPQLPNEPDGAARMTPGRSRTPISRGGPRLTGLPGRAR